MRNLLNLISRYYFFFLFLFLETIAMIMIVNSHQYQASVLSGSANRITAFFHGIHTGVSEYFALDEINQQLVVQNNHLLHQTPFSYLKTDQQVFVYNDTLFQRRYSYSVAGVINNSVNKRNNFLVLDKGRRHGVEPDMGVITPMGIVGIIKDVSENFSTAISLLNGNSFVSVRMKSNDHLGTLQWDGKDYRKANVLYIPSHAQLNKGDTIVSSGFSVIFPPDIPVGTISEFEIFPGENYYTVTVDLFLDFNILTSVHIVNNLYKEEIEALEEETVSDS